MSNVIEKINTCGIPTERIRPEDLVEITSDVSLVSNSNRTKSLRVFQRQNGTSIGEKYLEKTFKIPDNNSGLSDHKEILFYSELSKYFTDIPGVKCAKAHAIRWAEDSTVTLRLDFVPDSVVAESVLEKENAMIAAGKIANHFYRIPECWPTWLVTSSGIGTKLPESSIAKTASLLRVLGLSKDQSLLTDFYAMRRCVVSVYQDSPTSIQHGDANHQNIRYIPKCGSTLFLDWPRIQIASVSNDAARIIQPWIVFHGNATKMAELVEIETGLYEKFSEELTYLPKDKLSSVRAAYEIRTIANAIALGGHILSWLQSSGSSDLNASRLFTARIWYQIILTRIRGLKMNAECAIDSDRISPLKDRYLGKGASEYNMRRKGNARWQMEHRIAREFLARHRGKSVLDMPVGTGRFLELYQEFGMSVYAMDRSSDMLAESQTEAQACGLTDITLVLGDATTFNPHKLKSDIVVCTRFLNWLPTDLAQQAFLLLAEACQEEMLITLTSIDESKFEGAARKRIEDRLKNMHVPKPGDTLPPNGAHSYLQFQEWIKTANIQLVETKLLLEGRNHLRVETHHLRKLG